MTAVDDTFDESALRVLRRGWRVVPELHRGIGFTLFLALIGSLARLVVPVVLQLAIDRGLKRGDVQLDIVVRLCLIGLVVLVVTALSMRWAQLRLGIRSETGLAGLRGRVFAHLQELSLEEHAAQRRGALVARVSSDIETISQFFSWSGIAWLVNISLMAVAVVAMSIYNWRLTAVTLVVSFPVAITMHWLQGRLVAAYSSVRHHVGEYLAVVSEVVSGAATVRAYHMTDSTTERVHHANTMRRDASIRSIVVGSLLFPTVEFFSVVTVAAVVGVGLWLGPASGLTVGGLVSFVFLTGRFLEPLAEFGEILNDTQTAVAGIKRVLDVMDLPVEVVDPTNGVSLAPGAPPIELDRVTFRYRPRADETNGAIVGGAEPSNSAPALQGVSVFIEAGSSVAVVGHTGSGKSTLAKLLARLADVSEGVVRIGGVDVREVSRQSLRSTVLLVPQEPFLFDSTIAANVRFAKPEATDQEVLQAAAELGLTDWLAALPNGLDTQVGERGDALSAGERQLVALTRAQLAQRPCLVLDEATSSVDPGTEARVARAVERLTRGRTTITIAHRLSTAVRADRILVFDHGCLVQDGSHRELVAVEGVYASLHRHWMAATAV
jgi:ATP-binding cassette subfamily B protein